MPRVLMHGRTLGNANERKTAN